MVIPPSQKSGLEQLVPSMDVPDLFSGMGIAARTIDAGRHMETPLAEERLMGRLIGISVMSFSPSTETTAFFGRTVEAKAMGLCDDTDAGLLPTDLPAKRRTDSHPRETTKLRILAGTATLAA
jgi:hypothetical protein